jgi:hypothetical protein
MRLRDVGPAGEDAEASIRWGALPPRVLEDLVGVAISLVTLATLQQATVQAVATPVAEARASVPEPPVASLVHLHRSFYAIEAAVIYSGYETTHLYPTLD